MGGDLVECMLGYHGLFYFWASWMAVGAAFFGGAMFVLAARDDA